MLVPRRNLFKNELARKLGISPQTLTRFLSDHENEIKRISPSYRKRSQILYPKVIDYIIQELGFSPEEIYGV